MTVSPSDRSICPRCGRPRKDTTAGLCPRCLMQRAAESWPLAQNPTPPDPEINDRSIGGYELLEEIARGGMGVVFRARQPELDRTVALKLLLAGEWASPEFVERFRTEARASASLDHPHIVAIYEHGEVDEQWFLAMQFIEGSSLADKLKADGPLDPRPAAELVATLARAVHYAHQRGVLHRDLKPANVLLDREGAPHLSDFGLARLIDDDSAALTRTLAVLGTPAYLAPEQAAGHTHDVTTAADVYGLGAIFFEVLTAEPPFRGNSALDTLHLVTHGEVPRPSGALPAVNRDLDTVCIKCLEKEPARRYPSALALAEDLERWLRGEPLLARPPGTFERTAKWIRRHPWQSALAAVATLALLAVSTVSLISGAEVRRANREVTALASEQQRELAALQVVNGNRAAEQGDTHRALLWFAAAAQLDAERPERSFAHRMRFAMALRQSPQPVQGWHHPGGAHFVAFSPDGNWLASAGEDNRALLVNRATGLSRSLHAGAPVLTVAFSPDNTLLATRTHPGAIQLWNVAQAAEQGRAVPVNARTIPRYGHPLPIQFLPNESGFLAEWKNQATLCDLEGNARLTIDCPAEVSQCRISPDGSKVALVSTRGGLIRVHDAANGALLAERTDFPGPNRVSWFPDNQSLMVSSNKVFIVQRFSAADLRTLHRAEHREFTFSIQPNPDGSEWLLFGHDEYARLADAQLQWTGPPMRHRGLVNYAVWDAACRRVATAGANGVVRLWNARTGKPVAGEIHHAGEARHAAFSPDGRQLLTCGSDGVVRLWNLPPPNGARVRKNHHSPTQTAAFSPDGRRLISTSLSHVALLWNAADGSEYRGDLGHQYRPYVCSWNADGTAALTISANAKLFHWDLERRKVSHHCFLQGFEEGTMSRLAFSPDGMRIAVLHPTEPVQMFDTHSGELLWQAERKFTDFDPEFDPARKVLLLRREQGFALLDVESGTLLREVPTPGNAIALSLTANRVAWHDGSHHLWLRDLDHPGSDRRAGRHFSHIFMGTFIHDGRVLATASYDSTVRLWDAETGEAIGGPLPHGNRALRLLLSPDRKTLLSHSSDHYVRLWDVTPSDLSPAGMQDRAEEIAGHRLGPDGELLPPGAP